MTRLLSLAIDMIGVTLVTIMVCLIDGQRQTSAFLGAIVVAMALTLILRRYWRP